MKYHTLRGLFVLNYLSELLFCASVSLDGFTLGCSYGIRKISATLFTVVISAIICGLSSTLAIIFGRLFLSFISEEFSSYLGATLLIFLGILTAVKGYRFKNQKTPEFNRKITKRESVVLSLTVSIDAFSAGLGYAMLGHYSLIIPIGVGIFHSLFIYLGISFSQYISKHFKLSNQLITFISSGIFFLLAISKFIF